MTKKPFVKRLSAVEAEPDRSNQHEFNGVGQLKDMLGPDRKQITAVFSVRGQSESYEVRLTWYDARKQHQTRSEYRLYFKTNPVMALAQEGDQLVFTLDSTGVLICELVKLRG